MDYQKIYTQLIERAKTRNLEGYTENHHVVPRCLGGDDNKNNLVQLTAREHFLCHMLLCEIYPNNIRLIHSVFMMSNIKKRKNFQNNIFISSRLYEYIKLKRSKLQKEQWYKKRKEQGLIINEENINLFVKIYSNFNLTENNKHCINYCVNNKLEFINIICKCSKGIKRFKNYTKGYQKYCSQKCSNLFTKEISNITKEKKGIWSHSKKRLRQQEIKLLGKENIEILRRKRISEGNKGKRAGLHSRGKLIIQLDLNNNFVKEWSSIRQAGLELANTNGETIRKCLVGSQKTAYGFKWKYKL